MEEKIFVAGLQPQQQYALRLLLNNYLKIQMKMVMNHFLQHPTASEADKKWKRLRSMLDMYESMTYNYPVRETVHQHKAKLMFYNGATMKYIIASLEIFSPDPNESTLDDNEVQVVKKHAEKLDKLMRESLRCPCTADDIKRIKG